MKVTVLMTCYNRKKFTLNCIRSLAEGNPDIDFRFIVTDDNSADGTAEALKALPWHIEVLYGNGQLFWNGGMYLAIEKALGQAKRSDYYLLVNDDVDFYRHAVEKLADRQRGLPDRRAVVVGSTVDSRGEPSYGGIRLLSKHFAKFSLVPPSVEPCACDTFNGNCVLIPAETFFKAGNLDPFYRHSMSDFDYGMGIKRMGIPICNSAESVGKCDDNDAAGSWRDTSLARKERLMKKEGPKGLPRRDWFHFVRKNFGFLPACYHTITPYVRILFGK